MRPGDLDPLSERLEALLLPKYYRGVIAHICLLEVVPHTWDTSSYLHIAYAVLVCTEDDFCLGVDLVK